MFLITFLVSLPIWVILIAVSILLAVLGVFLKKSTLRPAKRMARKSRKGVEKVAVKEAEKSRKKRLAKEQQRNERVQVKPARKQLVAGPKGQKTMNQRAAAQKRAVVTSTGQCGRTTERGTACRQPRLKGKDHCQYHKGKAMQGSAPKQKQQVYTSAPAFKPAPKVVNAPAPAPKPVAPAPPPKPQAPKVTRTTNVASSGFTPVQVGQQFDSIGSSTPKTSTPKPSKPSAAKSSNTNHASPGAKVGTQADTIIGNVNVDMSKRDKT